MRRVTNAVTKILRTADAHCDGPCGVYDPASARIAGEAVQSMTKKMVALEENHGGDCNTETYLNTMSRYAAIKEEEAQKCKDELLVTIIKSLFSPVCVNLNPTEGISVNNVLRIPLTIDLSNPYTSSPSISKNNSFFKFLSDL